MRDDGRSGTSWNWRVFRGAFGGSGVSGPPRILCLHGFRGTQPAPIILYKLVPHGVGSSEGGAELSGKELLLFGILLGGWFLLNRYLLPKMGVST